MNPFCITSWDFLSDLFNLQSAGSEAGYKAFCGVVLFPTFWGIPLIFLVVGIALIGAVPAILKRRLSRNRD